MLFESEYAAPLNWGMACSRKQGCGWREGGKEGGREAYDFNMCVGVEASPTSSAAVKVYSWPGRSFKRAKFSSSTLRLVEYLGQGLGVGAGIP